MCAAFKTVRYGLPEDNLSFALLYTDGHIKTGRVVVKYSLILMISPGPGQALWRRTISAVRWHAAA